MVIVLFTWKTLAGDLLPRGHTHAYSDIMHSLIRPVNHSLMESYGVSPKYVNSWSTLLVRAHA
jgi:hypothetical protein